MKRLRLIISLFFLLLILPSSARGACVAPIGPAFDTCPSQNPKYCYVRNDYTGSDLTCCLNQQECDARQSTGETHDFTGTGTQLTTQNNPAAGTGNNFNPFCNGTSGVNTALGCISTNPNDFITTFLGFGVGIAGGIAFLLILFGGFQILTSAGNPEQMNAGKELISSAIAGLLLIIFSIFLLKVIGVNILGLPDFG